MTSNTPLASRRILIVDDQPSIREVLRTALSDAGAEVLDADGGAAALDMVKIVVPELILLDLAMPGMTGWQVLEALRASPDTREIPVILQTSSGDFPSFEQARRQGVAAFISKPFRLGDVVETCRRTLQGARPFQGQEAAPSAPLPAQVRDAGGQLMAVGRLIEADAGGAQLEMDRAITPGEAVVLTVQRPEGSQTQRAEVRWVTREDTRFILGLRFKK